jgi:hypothetical protein
MVVCLGVLERLFAKIKYYKLSLETTHLLPVWISGFRWSKARMGTEAAERMHAEGAERRQVYLNMALK